MTPFQLHVKEWKNCTRCSLSKTRQTVVLCRGRLPCDILFVGEAPGESEDVLGEPMIGPAGKLFDRILRAALPTTARYAITNLIGCIPYEEQEGDRAKKAGEPPDFAVETCKPRLESFIILAKPKVIICVGKKAEEWLKQGYKHSIKVNPPGLPQENVVHPAWILRANEAQKGLAFQRSIITIRNAYRKYVLEPEPQEDLAPLPELPPEKPPEKKTAAKKPAAAKKPTAEVAKKEVPYDFRSAITNYDDDIPF